MKGKKYVGLIFLLVCIAMVGYVGFSIYTQVQADIAEWKATTWFVFRNDIDSFDGAEYVTVEELMDYEVKTDVYNPKVYYASLNEREQLAYKAFQYALDNNFIYTFIDESVLDEGDLQPMDIVALLSLDSAIVQQNMSNVEYLSSYTMSRSFYGYEVEKDVEGFSISTETFSEKRIARVNEAIAELESVDFDFTEQTTDEEKAKKIFEYVERNVNYTDNVFAGDDTPKGSAVSSATGAEDYLYSAVFKGKTNCDGFANMYSLLCQMNGVKCIEKLYYSKVEGDPGHTWNCVSVNGKWYNVDCTESTNEQDEREYKIQTATQFGFSDELQQNTHEYARYVPSCTENLMSIDGTFSTAKASGMSSKIASYIRESEDGMAVIVIYNFNKEDFADTMQSTANALWSDVEYVYIQREKCYICCVYKD